MKKLVILLLALFAFSCAEAKKEPGIRLADYNHTDAYTSAEAMKLDQKNKAEAKKAKQKAMVVEVSLEGTDQMKFNKDEIKVPAGATVKLTLTHVGQLPASAMGHNFVLLKKGTDVTAFGVEAINFPNNNYIPENTDKVIASTEIIGGGESVTIEFTAPEPGTYTFVCTFPGHFSMMQGKFIAE